jgi:hypothetical protein
LAIGRFSPIIPVDAIKTLFGLTETLEATSLHIDIESFIPFWPVHALALPELTTTAEILAVFRCCLHTVTDAETILLVVKTAAALAPAGQTISPKSSLPLFLTPPAAPAAKNPFGAVIVLFAISFFPEKVHF